MKVIWEIDHVPVVRFRSRLVMAMVTTKNIRYRVIFSTTRGEFSHFGGSNDVKISIFGAKYLRDPPPLGVPASITRNACLMARVESGAPRGGGYKALLVVRSCNHFTSKFCFFGALVGPNKVLETHLAQLT